MTPNQDAKLGKIARLNEVFTPSTPISKRAAFAGRFEQIMQITGAVSQPGRHIVLYGERGVGKTSLANILSELLIPTESSFREYAVRINCSVDDKFSSVWTRIFTELGLEVPTEWAYGSPSPDEIRQRLAQVEPPMVIVIDEYDRLDDDSALSLMADTIKSLSDHTVRTKLVLVGVSDSIEQLIGEHESVRRALEEVNMPRMARREIAELIIDGFREVQMVIEDNALGRIARLAEGLPTYAHALSLRAGTLAIQDDEDHINLGHVERAAQALVASPHSSKSAYLTATQSPRPENLFAQVLAACALAEKDELGYFTPASMKEPLSAIMGRTYDIPAFSRHLSEFISDARGPVLQRKGEPRKYRYRFRDPLMQPFAIMAALSQQLIPAAYQQSLFRLDEDVDWNQLIDS
ncbi:AAA family ATPase [Microbacterium enclense]|uniref:AAA family ATPase n=1 Tax=Microbacterium enclense TaxID=993073 RepID=A0A3S3P2E2_9MICO|nr:AAA family ATPase [Microbacterium enclense]RWR16795.1 AAA family ATPase [Microbacterium enclense]